MSLPSPRELKKKLSLSLSQIHFLNASRETLKHIMRGKEKRFAIVAGPCSIHDLEAALEYAENFKKLSNQVHKSCFLVMRAYVEKPRTTEGWKGLLYDPDLDGSCDLARGIYLARKLFLELARMEVPVATEFVDPLAASYFSDLITWGFIGARTSASQPHRQLASSLPFPIGFKNGLDGRVEQAIHGVVAAGNSHVFLQLDENGQIDTGRSEGNPHGHIVLRGSTEAPNYHPYTLLDALKKLRDARLPARLLVDCAHGNCQKQYEKQKEVFRNVIGQVAEGNQGILGIMLESHLKRGNQLLSEDPSSLEYAVSITDPCIDWVSTEELVGFADSLLSSSAFSLR